MATSQTEITLSGLAWRLVRDQLMIGRSRRKSAYRDALKQHKPFVQYLVEQKILDSRRIAIAAADEFGVPLLDLDAIDPRPAPEPGRREAGPEAPSPAHLPARKPPFLAVSDPTNHRALDEIRFNTGMATDAVLVEETKLAAAIDKAIEAQDTTMSDILDTDLDNLDIASEEDEHRDDSELNVDEAPSCAMSTRSWWMPSAAAPRTSTSSPTRSISASDSARTACCRKIANPPINLAARLVARLKVMSRMNIAERRVPQDGRIKLKLSRNRDIDFRVNTLPTLYGEKGRPANPGRLRGARGHRRTGLRAGTEERFLSAIESPTA